MTIEREPVIGVLLIMKEGRGEDITSNFLDMIEGREKDFRSDEIVWVMPAIAEFGDQISKEIGLILKKIGRMDALFILTDNADWFTEKLAMDTFRGGKDKTIIISHADEKTFESLMTPQPGAETIHDIAMRALEASKIKAVIMGVPAEPTILQVKDNVIWGKSFGTNAHPQGKYGGPPVA